VQGRKVRLTFQDFQLEAPLVRNNRTECQFDYLQVGAAAHTATLTAGSILSK
jgi:hypothetical protein